MIYKRTAIWYNPCLYSNMARALTKSVQRNLLEEYQWRTKREAAENRTLLEPSTGDTYLCGVYSVIKRWYRHASNREPYPS